MKMTELLRKQLEALEAERAVALAAAEAIAETAETEERSALTVDEDATLAEHVAAVKAADETIALKRARLAELEQIDERTTVANKKAPVVGMAGKPEDIDPTSRWAPVGELKARARGMVEASRLFTRDEHKEAATKLLERGDSVGEFAARLALATGTPEYFTAWSRYNQGLPLTSEDAEQLNRAHEIRTAMTSGGTSAGGYAVPVMLDSTFVLTGAGSSNPFRQLAKQMTITTNVWKGVTAAQVTASYDNEAAEVSDDAPTLSQPSITPAMGRAFVPYSIEAEMDIPDLIGQLSTVLLDARDNLDASNFATSTSEPKGVVASVDAVTASRVSVTTPGTFAVGDVYRLHQALPARHRLTSAGSRAFVMNVTTINTARQFATSNNTAAFLQDLGGGQPTRMLGETLVESSAMSSTVTTGNAIAVYGDFQKFLIVDRLGLTSERIQTLYATANNLPSFSRGFAVYWRTGAGVLDTDAFRVLRG